MVLAMSALPKVALITGAAKRLGKAIALALAQQGWDIAVHYHQSASEAQVTADEIVALGRRALLVQADLSDEMQTLRLLPQAEALGPVTCLINNASRFVYDAIDDFTFASLQAHLLPNLATPIVLARELHARLPVEQQGVVVNLLDQKLHNLNPDFLSYTLSKAGLETATTLLAQALAPTVRVVGVAPGITLVSGDQTEESFIKAHAQTPLGYSSAPEDVAAAVCYAVSARAVTGTTLVVDGGQHLMPLPHDVMFMTR